MVSNLENWFLNYFPFITVNHKKGLIPCACDSRCVPPREPVQVETHTLEYLGDAGIVVAIQY